MSDSTPAIAAGAAACTPAELHSRQLGFVLWFYRSINGEPRSRDERLTFLRAGIALRAAKLGEATQGTAEQIDAALLSLWYGFSPNECNA